MKICLLTDQDLDGELDPDDFACDPRPYLPEAEWSLAVMEIDSSVSRIHELAGTGQDLFFNLCDGAWDEGRPGIEVILTLERLGLPFTGASSECFEPSREAMKRVCSAWGIDTPGYVLAREEADLERALDTLRFPMIVKHPSSYASIDLTRDSRVQTPDALRERARLIIGRYRAALIEEFVEGGEATVLVAEGLDGGDPVTYRPIRYRFPEGETFKHYDLKWEDYKGLQAEPVGDPVLDAALRRASADFFTGLRGAGYGRCDLRIDRDGRPWMLEINPNPGLYYELDDPGSADLILMHDEAGHAGFTRHVVEAALARHRRGRQGWRVLPSPRGGYGLFTTRAFRPGERVVAFDDTPHQLVTASRVEATWDEPRRSWFDRYAWPLTDEVWVTWGADPMEWRPVDHGCDPSTWIDGLDVVARRPLEPGDEITLDYATIYNERMPAFECSCGSPECRGIVRGDDYRRDFVARYGDHVTEWVRRARVEEAEAARS